MIIYVRLGGVNESVGGQGYFDGLVCGLLESNFIELTNCGICVQLGYESFIKLGLINAL